MKKYNEVIQVEVEVDLIASQLVDALESTKHKELIAETIIDLGLKNSDVTYIYNSLNGIIVDLDFEIGEQVVCSKAIYDHKERYSQEPTKEGSDPSSTRREIGLCSVVEIDKYADRKLYVEYDMVNSSGKVEQDKKWIDHRTCSKSVEENGKSKIKAYSDPNDFPVEKKNYDKV